MEYGYWCSCSESELAADDVASVNISIAAGLPGSESLDPALAVSRLDRWAELVALNTKHWSVKFVPQDDCRSEAQFRMMAMITLLQRDLGVKFNSGQMTGPFNALDSRDQFLHGALSDHGGTCCSLPILYLAIGRRLGYPLHLVNTIQHSFVRWDDPHGERFNVECAGTGFRVREDEHYRRWPVQFTDAERVDRFYLTNLTRRQELAGFIGTRGFCLRDNLKMAEAVEAFHYASKLEPRYISEWALTSLMERIMNNLRSRKLSPLFPIAAAIDLACRIPIESWEQRLLADARQDLLRIAELHEQRSKAQFEALLSRPNTPNLR